MVWLPPGYDAGTRRCPVVSMHDGQNLFFRDRSGFDKVFANEGPVFGDRYLRFLVAELEPRIDRHNRTHPDVAHTAIVGSSMGGLISCHAFVRYPGVFGRAGCVSTHWLLTTPDTLPPGTDVLALWDGFLAREFGNPAVVGCGWTTVPRRWTPVARRGSATSTRR